MAKINQKKAELKKLFTYSTIENKRILDAMLADESEASGQSQSKIIETNLIESMFPKNQNGRYWIEQLYMSSESHDEDYPARNTIGDVMETIFAHIAAGCDMKTSEKDTRDLVEYAHEQLLFWGDVKQNKEEYKYFFSCMESILSKLSHAKDHSEIEQKYRIEDELRFFKPIMDEADGDDFFCTRDLTLHVYQVILSFWDILGNYTYTFRLLCCLTAIQTWNETAGERVKLVKLIKETTEKW